MDVDALTRELYGLRPQEFTAARDVRAADRDARNAVLTDQEAAEAWGCVVSW
ncbi:hypothetical protein [Streptomyces sp. NPDC055005]